jgi:hypothetical protein
MGDCEFAKCDMCKKDTHVSRKYYSYDIKCDCCNDKNDNHFEIVRYCKDCEPKPKRTITLSIEPIITT